MSNPVPSLSAASTILCTSSLKIRKKQMTSFKLQIRTPSGLVTNQCLSDQFSYKDYQKNSRICAVNRQLCLTLFYWFIRTLWLRCRDLCKCRKPRPQTAVRPYSYLLCGRPKIKAFFENLWAQYLGIFTHKRFKRFYVGLYSALYLLQSLPIISVPDSLLIEQHNRRHSTT